MKRKRLYTLWLAEAMMLALASCDIHTSGNGAFDGYWHLVQVDTLSTGNSLDMSERRVFWGVQAHLIQAIDHDNDPSHYGYLFYFEKDDASLRLYYAHRHNREAGDILIEDAAELSPLGVNDLNDKFRIITLDHSRMVLEDDLLRLSFRKQ